MTKQDLLNHGAELNTYQNFNYKMCYKLGFTAAVDLLWNRIEELSNKLKELQLQLENKPTTASRWREKYYDKINELNALQAQVDKLEGAN